MKGLLLLLLLLLLLFCYFPREHSPRPPAEAARVKRKTAWVDILQIYVSTAVLEQLEYSLLWRRAQLVCGGCLIFWEDGTQSSRFIYCFPIFFTNHHRSSSKFLIFEN